jgi:hypothetical protein
MALGKLTAIRPSNKSPRYSANRSVGHFAGLKEFLKTRQLLKVFIHTGIFLSRKGPFVKDYIACDINQSSKVRALVNRFGK